MTMSSIPACVDLYVNDRRSYLVGIIASLEEELETMATHKWNAQKRADRERALAGYRASLSRLDVAAASKPAVVN